MKLNFIKANPTENMTIFISDPLPRAVYSDVANRLMDYSSLCGEQVGFIEKPTMEGSVSRLHMMGGEFCGNAARAFAALMVQQHPDGFSRENGAYQVPIEVSGSDNIVWAQVKELTDHLFDVRIQLPMFQSAAPFETHYNGVHYQGVLVEFDGISHVVLFTGNDLPDEGLLRHIVREQEPLNVGAFGVMFYREEDTFMTPLVYVEDTKSVIWERSCGTGTAALGVALSIIGRRGVDMQVNQPGGRLEILTTMQDGAIIAIHLAGEVSIVAEGHVFIPFETKSA